MCLVLDSDHWGSVFVSRLRLDLKFRYVIFQYPCSFSMLVTSTCTASLVYATDCYEQISYIERDTMVGNESSVILC